MPTRMPTPNPLRIAPRGRWAIASRAVSTASPALACTRPAVSRMAPSASRPWSPPSAPAARCTRPPMVFAAPRIWSSFMVPLPSLVEGSTVTGRRCTARQDSVKPMGGYSSGGHTEGPAMLASVFIGTSVDGFIARADDSLDWLPEGGGEPHGYDEFMASVDAIVIGRKTFEKVLTLGPWHYGKKRVVVLSSRPVALSAAVGGVVEQMAGPPAEIVSRLAASGATHVYVDGGIT